MRFSIPMIKSEDILEKDNGGIQEITERERTVSSFTVVVEREQAAAAACEDGVKRRRQRGRMKLQRVLESFNV
ncbi:hypothetical protein RHGRI_030165 [Rhododendron griersonianum]|uniref:Uncharacterized protein n=1 Tax=Rhododendron griersonianum TaxID=479676 RepID=A0AAV6ISC2_9ERIC|nr:hypothetical protein RHGRI_030165 [Rhododendron griersonianum]